MAEIGAREPVIAPFSCSGSEIVTIIQPFNSLTGITDTATFKTFEEGRERLPIEYTNAEHSAVERNKSDISPEHRSLPAKRSC